MELTRPGARLDGVHGRQRLAQPCQFFSGRPAIVEFLRRKWARELDYRLIKEVWAFEGARIAVRNFGGSWDADPTIMQV